MNFRLFLSIFFPQRCVGCNKNLRSDETVICGDCARTISISLVPPQRRHSSFQFFIGGAVPYENKAVKGLVHALKFKGVLSAAPLLGNFLSTYASALPMDLSGFIVIPIPLSKIRFRARGFNQSELIAKKIAADLGLDIEAACLTRVRHTKPQSETKSLAERKENIRGCFSIINRERIAGRDIILIDDVTTSGTTFREAAIALAGAGVRSIQALAVAIA